MKLQRVFKGKDVPEVQWPTSLAGPVAIFRLHVFLADLGSPSQDDAFPVFLVAVPISIYIFFNTMVHRMQKAVCHHPVRKAACTETQGWGLTAAVSG